jgi:hypothetical protein
MAFTARNLHYKNTNIKRVRHQRHQPQRCLSISISLSRSLALSLFISLYFFLSIPLCHSISLYIAHSLFIYIVSILLYSYAPNIIDTHRCEFPLLLNVMADVIVYGCAVILLQAHAFVYTCAMFLVWSQFLTRRPRDAMSGASS